MRTHWGEGEGGRQAKSPSGEEVRPIGIIGRCLDAHCFSFFWQNRADSMLFQQLRASWGALGHP